MQRRGSAVTVGVALALGLARPAWCGDFYILHTEEARTVGEDNLRLEVQAGVRKQGDASELYNLPRVRVEYGLGEWADLEFEADALLVARGTDIPPGTDLPPRVEYNADEVGGGDLRVRLKLVPFHTVFGDVGTSFETKLPDADDEDGLGTDRTDFTAKLLYSADWSQFTDAPILRRLTTHANAGMAILGDPAHNREQLEYFVWGVAAEYPLTDRLVVMGELEGAHQGERTRNIAEGAESADSVVARVAMTRRLNDDWTAGVSAGKGLTDDALDWDVQVGVSRMWGTGYERGGPRAASPEMRLIDPDAPWSYLNPLWTEEAQNIGANRFRGELALGYVNQADDSHLYEMPKLIAGWGIGPWADVELEYHVLRVEDTDVMRGSQLLLDSKDATGSGDTRLHLKVVPWRFRVGDMGLKISTKIPTADDRDGLGTDEADVEGRLMLSSNWGSISSNAFVSRLTTHLNAGIAVQEDPFERSEQDDIALWGAAVEYALTDEWALWAEIHGAVGGSETDNIAEGTYGRRQLVARAGVSGPVPELDLFPRLEVFHDWTWSAAVGAGLNHDSPELTGQVALSHTWGLE